MSNNTIGNTKQNTASIDLVKLIMAIIVVAIHTKPLDNVNNATISNLFHIVSELAVPFFFISTGYLLGLKIAAASDDVSTNEILSTYLKKILKLYVVWSAVYFPLAVIKFLVDGVPFLTACLFYVRGFLLIGENYNSWPLWYLLSTIYTLIVLIFLIKKRVPLKVILFIGFCAISVGFFINWIVVTDQELPLLLTCLRKIAGITIVNGRLFRGMFYIPLGILLSQKSIPTYVALLMTIFGVALSYNADFLLFNYAVVICSMGIFSLTVRLNMRPASWLIKCRKISTDMYFFHMWVWTVYYVIVYQEKHFGMDSFLVTTCTCIILSFAIQYISPRKHMKIL